MGVMDSLIVKSLGCADLAEWLGLDEEAAAYRRDGQAFRKIRDGLGQIGEEIQTLKPLGMIGPAAGR